MKRPSASGLVMLVALSACGARTGLADVAGDAASEASHLPGDAGCAATCGAGQVCIHDYETHDPPPPLPDGGTCTHGIEHNRRCWSVIDRCGAVPDGCSSGHTCTCPPVDPKGYWGCECQSDGTFNCYIVGV